MFSTLQQTIADISAGTGGPRHWLVTVPMPTSGIYGTSAITRKTQFHPNTKRRYFNFEIWSWNWCRLTRHNSLICVGKRHIWTVWTFDNGKKKTNISELVLENGGIVSSTKMVFNIAAMAFSQNYEFVFLNFKTSYLCQYSM